MKHQKTICWSAGHGRLPLWYFRYKLLQNGINLVIDARTFPSSRFSPQYNRRALEQELAKKGISYSWRGKNCGGRGVNVNYEETIDEIVALVRSGLQVCVLCSEEDYHKCHRHTMIEPSLNERGIEIIHISYADKPIKKKPRTKQPRLFP